MHNGIRGVDVIDPSSLSPDEKESFIDSLYKLHLRIFDGGHWGRRD